MTLLRRTPTLGLAIAVSALALAAMAQTPPRAAAGRVAPPSAGDGLAANALRGRLGSVDTAAALRGEPVYASLCAFCHGGGGRGAQGPRLTSSLLMVGQPDGKALHAFLQVGRPATGMPPFPDLTESQALDLAQYMQARATEEGTRREQVDPRAILVGDARAGKAYFEGDGGCARCHSATGDFAGIGGRYDPMILQARMINPRTVGRGQGRPANPPPMTAKVTLPGGQVSQGRLIQVNAFFVTLVDQAGVRRTFERDGPIPKVEIDDPVEAHRQQMLKWTDQNMWNVTAYLASLK